METSLRIVLILVAVLILLGIGWDTLRSRRKKSNSRKITTVRLYNKVKSESKASGGSAQEDAEEDSQEETDLHNLNDMNLLEEEVIVVKPTKSSANALTNTLTQTPKLNTLKGSHPSSHTSSRENAAAKKRFFNTPDKPSDKKYNDYKTNDFKTDDVPDDFDEENIPEIIVLNVLAKRPRMFTGKRLLEVFNEAHLYFSDNQYFNRYEHNDGSGRRIFSLISAIEPGYFELSQIEQLSTPGLTLFFTSSSRNQSIAAFELMLRTAKLLAQRLDGELMDQHRKVLTSNEIEKYRERVRLSLG